MIYKKDVNFPYPVLTNSCNSYRNCYFDLDVKLSENRDVYDIGLDPQLDFNKNKYKIQLNYFIIFYIVYLIFIGRIVMNIR